MIFSRSGIRSSSVALPRALQAAALSQFPGAAATAPAPVRSSVFGSIAAQVAPPKLDDHDEREPVTSPRVEVDANRQRRKLVAPSSHESPSFLHDPIAM